MAKKPKDVKIGAISGTKSSENVKAPDSVTSVEQIAATQSVGLIKAVGLGQKRRSTRIMSAAEREQLFKMINEEADKLFKNSGISEEKRGILADAVKMAVDSGIIDETQVKDKKDAKK